jgi:hypothetical protein
MGSGELQSRQDEGIDDTSKTSGWAVIRKSEELGINRLKVCSEDSEAHCVIQRRHESDLTKTKNHCKKLFKAREISNV